MRVRRTLAAGLTAVLVIGLSGVTSYADETFPSEDEVRGAERQAAGKARDVAAIQADLAVANSTLDRSAEAAGRAAEAYNGVLWELEQAQAAAEDARASAKDAGRHVRRQQRQYGDALVRSYQSAPEISGVAAMVDADGVDAFIQQRVTMDNTMDALDGRYDRFRASATVAELSSSRAADAEEAAAELERQARNSRDAAASAAAAALAEAETLAQRKGDLIEELAELEGISVKLAQRRQRALEAEAAQRAEDARRKEQERTPAPAPDRTPRPTRTPDRTPAPDRTPTPAPAPDRTPDRTPAPTPDRTPDRTPPPAPKPKPRPEPAPAPVPAPASGAAAAVAFAASKIGDPYVWGASGPNAWDCSGLTAKAWATGGKSLPHWSIGQYRASTPIQSSQLRAGDLVFWGDSGDSSSIFHVALYAGDGMIIHAPRTGRPVVKESMYYWRAPNFYARP